MAPSTVILVRHSQAEHNVADDYSIPDAPLTKLGLEQSAELPEKSSIKALAPTIDLVCSSALKRTLQSTLLGWRSTVDRLGIKNVLCLPQLQECNDFPCDTGSPREVLEADPDLQGFNLDQLTPDWTSKQGFFAPDPASIAARAQWVRQFLRSRSEKTILVVAHGDILRQITASANGPSTYPWRNAEVQLWEFDPAFEGSQEAFLKHVKTVAAAGMAEPTSSDMTDGSTGGTAGTAAGGLQLPSLGSSLGFSDPSAPDANGAVAQIEARVREQQSIVQSRTNELQELEERLAAAEKKRAELEARGVKF